MRQIGRLVGAIVFVQAVAATALAQPAQPTSESPLERQMAARRLVERGEHARALELLLWCFDEGVERDPSYASVRNSFLIREIAELGKQHMPALEALRVRRDAAGQRLRQGGGDADDVTTFASINRQFDMNDATVALYDDMLLTAKDSNLLRLMARLSFDPLLEAQRYRDVEFGHPDLLETALRQFEAYEQSAPATDGLSADVLATMSQVRLKSLRESVGKYYEAMVALGWTDDARQVAEKLIEVDASAETYVDLARHALRSENPSADDVSLAREADARLGGRDATALALLAELMAMTGQVDPAVTMLQQRMPTFTSNADKTYLELTLRKMARYADPSKVRVGEAVDPTTRPAP